MRVDIPTLIAAGVAPTQARVFAEPLADVCERYAIDTRARLAAFLAQLIHESAGLSRTEECLYYRSAESIQRVFGQRMSWLRAAQLTRRPEALANVVYANRLGNGDEAGGDGWRFRGGGLIQLTGRGNYCKAAAAIGRPYVDNPALVRLPADASLTAGWYWSTIRGNDLADAGLIDDITRAINGPAMHAKDERRSLYDDAMLAFA